MNFFAVDLGSVNIKIARLMKNGSKFELESLAMAPSPLPAMANANEQMLGNVAKTILQLKQDSRITTKNVVASMPESEVFVRLINLPKMSMSELETAITWEAEQYIPLPMAEVNYSYTVVEERPDGGIDVLIVAAPLRLIEKYQMLFNMAGLELVALETELLAAARCVAGANASPVLVVDIGARSTDLAVVYQGKVVFSRAVSMAGAAITRSLMNGLQVDENQAESFKRSFGLDSNQMEGQVALAVGQVAQTIAVEISRTLTYYSSRTQTPISSVQLVGGSAILPQLPTYLTGMVNVEVQIGNVWSKIDDRGRGAQIDNPAQYAIVLGLAMKEV